VITQSPKKKLQIELSREGTEILNLECVVLPPGSNKEAIPLDATFKGNLSFGS